MIFKPTLFPGNNPLFRSREDIPPQCLIVSQHYYNNTTKKYSYMYANFGNFNNFFDYWYDKYENKKELCYLETILNHQTRKFYLDIDLDQKKYFLISKHQEFNPELMKGLADILMENLIQTLISIWPGMFSRPFDPDNDIVIYQSHILDVPDAMKYSYHVVFPKVFTSRTYCKSIFNYIYSQVDPFVQPCYDPGVYLSTQNFRMVYNYKCGKSNIKFPMTKWTFGNYTGSYKVTIPNLHPSIDRKRFIIRQMFQDSLLTVPPRTKPEVPKIPDQYDSLKNNSHQTKTKKTTHNQASPFSILPYFEEELIPEGFQLGEEDNYGYHLIRTSPSYCNVCDRIHDSQNAKLIYNREAQQWFFFCHRANQENKEVRMIPIAVKIDVDELLESKQ